MTNASDVRRDAHRRPDSEYPSMARKSGLFYYWIAVAIFTAILVFTIGFNLLRPHFTIGENDSLMNHLSYQDAITVAEQDHLPIYEIVDHGTRQKIDVNIARQLEYSRSYIQIDIPVYPGDVFDRRWGDRFIPAAGKPLPLDR